MSMQLQFLPLLSVSLEKTEFLRAIKNEPLESDIGIDDIPNSLDEEIIPDIKDIDIVSHELSENLIKSETVSENSFENNHSGSVEIQVFVKTENTPLIKTENIAQSEYLYKTQDISDGNVSRGTSQGVIEVQGKEGSNEHFNALQSDKQFVNFFKDSSDISRKAKCPNKTVFSECYKTVETTSCEKDGRKEKVIEVPVIPIEPHKYTSLAKTKHADNTNKNTYKQNKKSYCCEKCTFISKNHSYFKRHKLSHKTKAEVDSRYLKYRCDKCKYKTFWRNALKKHKLMHLKPEEIPYFYCYHCPYKSKYKGHLKLHIFNHFKKQEVPFHCYICDFTTLKRNLIIKHFKKHPNQHSICDKIDYETYTKKQMGYCCEKCTYTDVSSSNFKLHQLTHKTKAEIDDRLLKYRCDKCKYKTYWGSTLKAHKLTHLKPEEIHYLYCYHCSYKSKFKGNIQIHIFRHFKNEDVPFHCYICNFTTLKRNLIIKHFKKHPKHRSKCDETDYKKQLEAYTKKQMRCPNNLDHCGTIHFDDHANHIKKQKSEQPESTKSFVSRTESVPANSSKNCIFQCTYCPTKFSEEHLLKGHLQMHSSIKGIECLICTYRHNKTEILKHLSWHGANGNDSFKCPICDLKKRTKENMDDHLKVVHSKAIYQKHDSVCKNKICNGFCLITIGGNVGAE